MAVGQFIGVGGVARKVKSQYVGIGGVARKVKQGFIGVGGVARKCYAGETIIRVQGTNVESAGNGVFLYGQEVPAFSRVYGTIRVAHGYYPLTYRGVEVGSVEVPYGVDELTVSRATSSGGDWDDYEFTNYLETWDDPESYLNNVTLCVTFEQDCLHATILISGVVTTGESSHSVAKTAPAPVTGFDLYFVCEGD